MSWSFEWRKPTKHEAIRAMGLENAPKLVHELIHEAILGLSEDSPKHVVRVRSHGHLGGLYSLGASDVLIKVDTEDLPDSPQ